MSGGLFQRLGGQAIISNKGVYFQTPLFGRSFDGRETCLYAQVRGGYVQLIAGGATTAPDIKWSGIYFESGRIHREGRFGRPICPSEELES